jgi:hypothetical protein
MRTVRWCIFFAALLCVSATVATAGVGIIGPVGLEAVTAIPLGFQGSTPQKPGDMEIITQGSFTLPPGVTCDTRIITTLASADPDRSMFQLLIAAVTNGQPVELAITDDPRFTAFSGRCSLVYVTLHKKP